MRAHRVSGGGSVKEEEKKRGLTAASDRDHRDDPESEYEFQWLPDADSER